MYVTYDYYLNEYGGTKVTSSNFKQYELKARKVLENYTLKPKQDYKDVLEGDYSDNLKLAMCELIDNTHEEEKLIEQANKSVTMQLSGVSSETVKDHTVRIETKENSVLKVQDYIKDKNIRAMNKYLYPTNLLYRGVRYVRS